MTTYAFRIRAISATVSQAHILGFGDTPTGTALEVWLGPSNSDLKFWVGREGDVGMGSIYTGADVATNASRGFFGLPTCNGAPTGTPADMSATHAPAIYDRSNHRLYIYSGSWRSVALT